MILLSVVRSVAYVVRIRRTEGKPINIQVVRVVADGFVSNVVSVITLHIDVNGLVTLLQRFL